MNATDGQLLSHPDKPLSQHIAEVREAARAILRLHSPDAGREKLVEEIVSLHDLGKASAAFQEYIRDTSGYRDNRNKKAHTPVGFAAALLLGERLERGPFWRLCVAAAVLGHHTSFPNSRRLTRQYLRSDEWAEIIEEQAAGIPAGEVSELTGFLLAEILANPNLCDDADDVACELTEAVEKKAESDISSAVADRLKMQFAFNAWCELSVEDLSGRCPRARVGLPTDPEGKGTDSSSCSTWTPSSPHSTSSWTTSARPDREKYIPDPTHP